jgi:hsp70-interacting protein
MSDQSKWLGLMKWSMKYSDGTAPSEFSQISEEDKKFLEKVMKEGVIDETERVRDILRILDGEDPRVVFAKKSDDDDAKGVEQATEQQEEKATEEELDEYKEALLDELLTRIDQIDNAMNFVKMNGITTMIALMKENDRATTRSLAAEVCSVVVQNNPFCQDGAVKVGLLEVLCELARSDKDTTCKVKALLAISCLVRHHQAAEERFLSEDCKGFEVLESFLASETDLRLQRKSLFFLRYLVRQSPAVSALVHKTDSVYITSATRSIFSDDVDLCESSLEALTELAGLGADFSALLKDPKLELESKLTQRIEQINALEGEEKEYLSEARRMAVDLKAILKA